MRFQENIDPKMFAPCGMNCQVCYKHLKEKKACLGCLLNDDNKPEHCRKCKIKDCVKSKEITYCFECEDYPCKHIKYLNKSYIMRYGVSLTEMSAEVKENGLIAFMEKELDRWTCEYCGGIVSLHSGICSECLLKNVPSDNDSPYVFESLHLGFRRWQESDLTPFFEMNSSPEVMEFFPNVLTEEESMGFVERIEQHHDQYGYGLWAVELKKTKAFIGFIGFSNPTFESFFTPCVEIGWRLDHKYWNKGYATEGAKACLNYGFNKLGLKEIYSFTSEINTRSIKVMQKIGMKDMGTFNHPRLESDNPLSVHVLYKIEGGK